MKYCAFLLAFFLSLTVKAETIMLPVQDLLHQTPSFLAPRMGFNEALQGNYSISDIPKEKRKTRKELEKQLISFLWEEYPDARSIRIWNGMVIIQTS